MAHTYKVEYTDTFGGQANYGWLRCEKIVMPELTHYGYDGYSNYSKCNKIYERELMKKAKAVMGLMGVRGTVERYGDMIEFRPYKSCTVMFFEYCDE